jgi:hypothetical protein
MAEDARIKPTLLKNVAIFGIFSVSFVVLTSALAQGYIAAIAPVLILEIVSMVAIMKYNA